MKTIVVMPAYNAEKTLKTVFSDIARQQVDEVILCDDYSSDKTVEIARSLGIDVIVHDKNMGYGANQKTLYCQALARGADIVVMLHADNQYDATKIPQMIEPIKQGLADCVLGSRILGGGALKGGMPFYKYIANRFLTFFQNKVLGQDLSEYHTGLRAFSRKFLEVVPWQNNSDGFLFDAQILIQAVEKGLRIKEIPIPTRYFPEASEVGPIAGMKYGLGIFGCLAQYLKAKAKKKNGFTVIELTIVLLTVGILAIAMIVDFVPSLSAVRLDAAKWKLKSDIIYAQNLAVTQQTNHGVVFDTGANRYSVYRQNTSTIVNEPSTKQSFTVDYSTNPDFSGVSISSTSFGAPTTNRVEFDNFGVPSDGAINLTSNGTVTLAYGASSAVVTVTKNTGKVD